MRSTSYKWFGLALVLFGWTSVSQAQFISVNDHGSGPGTTANATLYNAFGQEDGNSGLLRDVNTGFDTAVTLTITNLGFVVGDPSGANPGTGTPLDLEFSGLVDFANSAIGNNIGISGSGEVVHTLTGLNPDNDYIIMGGAIRGGTSSFVSNRWSLFEIVGADSFDSEHTGGFTSAQFPGDIGPNGVAINTGANHGTDTGHLFKWTAVRSGPDGVIQIRSTRYSGSLPAGLSTGTAGYAPSALKVIEAVEAPPVIVQQPQSVVAKPLDLVTFTVLATGFPLSFQWYRDGILIPGATGSSFSIQATTTTTNFAYSVVVSNPSGSVTSDKAFIIFLPENQELVPWNKVWRYDTNGMNLGTEWREIDFGDSSWLSGPGPLGSEPGGLAGGLTLGTDWSWTDPEPPIITYYFRTAFVFDGEPTSVELLLTNVVDDGAVFYLNGQEILRVKMPDGPIDFTTTAAAGGENALFFAVLDSDALLPGTNIFAAEAHQINNTSSDTVMGVNLWTRPLPPGPLSIVGQPQNLTIEETKTAVLSVDVDGNGGKFQWFKDGVEVPGATFSSLVIPGVTSADAGNYYVTIVNSFSSLTSASANLSVTIDTNAPTVIEADGTFSSTNILVTFSEKIDEATATNAANYQLTTTALTEDFTIISLTLTNNGLSVWMETEPRFEGTNYIVVLNDLADTSPQANLIAVDTYAPVITEIELVNWDSTYDLYNPFVLFEPRYPGDGWQDPGFVVPGSWAFGSGPFVHNDVNNELPVSGPYFSLGQGATTRYFRGGFFFTASPLGISFRLRHMIDDGAIFYLNGEEFHRYNLPDGASGDVGSPVDPTTPGNPAVGAAQIVDVPSIPGNLSRGNNLVAVELHGLSDTDEDYVFGMQFLARIKSITAGPILITKQPEDQEVIEGQPVTFSFDGAGPSKFQWFKNGSLIPGATNATYTIFSTPLGEDGATFFARASNSDDVITTAVARLTVTTDIFPPQLISAFTDNNRDTTLISFNEFIDPTTGGDVANYMITNALGVNIPVLSATVTNNTNVFLTTGPLPRGGAIVVVNDVSDISQTPNVIVSGCVQMGFRGLLCAMEDMWKYDQSGNDLGTSWRTFGVDDETWLEGAGVFGVPADEGLPAPRQINTVLDRPNSPFIVTYYFRKTIETPSGLAGTVIASNLVDDGAIFYLNGQELDRLNMPAGTVTSATTASSAGDLGTANTAYHVFEFSGSDFNAGNNLLAVELHQGSTTSSDAVFGMELYLEVPSVVLTKSCSDLDISYDTSTDEVVISWDGGCNLIEAPDLSGPWTPVPGASSPYRVSPTEASRFYQLTQ